MTGTNPNPPQTSVLAKDPARLVAALFTLLPLPVAIVNESQEIVIANSHFHEIFPGVKNLENRRLHEIPVAGWGTFELEIVPLNDQGLQIVYGVDISNEACLRSQLNLLQEQLQRRIRPMETVEPVDLNEVVRNVLRLRQPQLKANGISVSMTLHSKLPHIKGDPKAIGKVLRVLIANAEQAIRERERSGSIHVKTSSESNRVRVSFCDSGCGISARRVNMSSVGVAIGLCAEIIHDHGGELFRWNSYNSGSIYTIELPAVPDTV